MNQPRFILEGIGGVYNYGCEAIVRGTVKILRKRWPCCHIIYVSKRLNDDVDRLKDPELKIIPFNSYVPPSVRFFNKLARWSRLPWPLGAKNEYRWLKKATCVLSIGGDLFTLYANEINASSFWILEHTEKILKTGIPIVLWGTSVGPFDLNLHALEAFPQILRKLLCILAREPQTVEYLAKLQIRKNVFQVADPAFLMEPIRDDTDYQNVFSNNKSIVAINFSPLSIIQSLGQEKLQEASQNQAGIIARITNEYDVNILLVPHVICPWNRNDDDYNYLQVIKQKVPSKFQKRIFLLPPDLGAQKTKGILSKCQVLVTARMHCAIAGVSMFIPTLFLSYSRKAVGMCEYIYGNREWVLPISANAEDLITTVGKLLTVSPDIHSKLEKTIPKIKVEAYRAADYLESMLV